MKVPSLRPFQFFFLCVLGVVVWILYFPALLGSRFIGDDYANLQQLSEVGIDGYASYIFSGITGTLGRPLSLLTFALQYQSWPRDAFAFKAVNVVIHILNGMLVYFLVRKLAGRLNLAGNEISAVSCIVAALWLLHPMQLTTTLYVIQRMTELSAFFTLAGILFYLRFRPLPGQEALTLKGFGTGLGIYVFILLAVLCKENGILLPLFLLVMEFTLYARDARSRAWKIWAWIFLGLPLILLCLYLVTHLDSLLAAYKGRPFTVQERLLTEAVILFDYLYKIVLPHPGAFTIFHDDFPIATGLFRPPVTFLALCGLAALLAVAFVKRRHWPLVSFGILWFFAGHVLESSFIGLELYFEHRNYLPSMGVIFLLAGTGADVARKIEKKSFFYFLLALYPVILLGITVAEIRLWTSPLQQAMEWVRHHPHSARAHGRLGDAYIISGDIDGAIRAYAKIAELYPDEVYPQLKQLALRACARNEAITDADWEGPLLKASRAKVDNFSNLAELGLIVATIYGNECPGINTVNLNRLIITLAENPAFRRVQSHFYDQASLLALYTGDLSGALVYVQKSINFSGGITRELFKAELLFAMGDTARARETVASIEKKMQSNYKDRLAHQARLSALKRKFGMD
ncbi:MAG: tetratricopeptide repeat protein [Gammaproteobacteria bacterium]